MAETLRERMDRRLSGMKTIRSDYEAEWNDIARFAQPARSRFLGTQKDQGTARRQRNNRLLDPHGIEAFRTLTNGLTSGLSSASRPWFTLRLKDEAINEQADVRAWLSEVERLMYSFLAGTNFYGAAKAGYAELGLFGTEACVMVEDRTQGAVCHALTAGEYWIAVGNTLVPDALYRRCPMSVRQAVQSFGKANSPVVLTAYDRGDYEQSVDVFHAIEPNGDYDPGRFGSKPWRSVYWDDKHDRQSILKESGYAEKPFWSARWDVIGGDTYGVSPGMESLPALRELQMQAKRRNEAIDAMVKPEKIIPPNVRLTGEPGRNVSASGVDRDQIIVPYQVPYQAVAAIGEEMDKCRAQIDGLSFADLFNAITNMRGVQPRNVEEIASRNEEKLTQLGPVIERVSNEKLEVAIDRAFGIMLRGGLLPAIPEALEDQQIDVEFVSILSQMQRMVGISQIERTASFVGNLAGVFPQAVDKLNVDEMIDEYAYRAGAPAKMVRSTKDVEASRAAAAQQQQMASVTGAEIAPARTAIKDLRLKAKEWFEANLRGTSVESRALGRAVTFNSPKKMLAFSGDAQKMRAIPSLPEIIAKGELLSTTAPYDKAREPSIKAYHRIGAAVRIGSEIKRVEITIREDANGNLFYDHVLPENAARNPEAPDYNTGPGESGSFDQVANKADNFNLQIQTLNDGPRGRIRFEQTPVIELFQGRNLSTLLHELGHQYLEELRFDAETPDAPAQLVQDMEAVKAWFAANGHPIVDGFIPVEAHARDETLAVEPRVIEHERAPERDAPVSRLDALEHRIEAETDEVEHEPEGKPETEMGEGYADAAEDWEA